MDREALRWILAALLVVAAVALWLYWTAPVENPLRPVYGVM